MSAKVHHLYRRDDPETSREAAESIVDDITAKQAMVITLLKAAGSAGMTDFEIARCLNHTGSTYRTRRNELVAQDRVRWTGRIQKHGESKFRVWALAEHVPEPVEAKEKPKAPERPTGNPTALEAHLRAFVEGAQIKNSGELMRAVATQRMGIVNLLDTMIKEIGYHVDE